MKTIHTEEVRRAFHDPAVLEAFRRYGAMGARKRNENLSAEQRSRIARKAARARWKKLRQKISHTP